jgi:hypothetical protein
LKEKSTREIEIPKAFLHRFPSAHDPKSPNMLAAYAARRIHCCYAGKMKHFWIIAKKISGKEDLRRNGVLAYDLADFELFLAK